MSRRDPTVALSPCHGARAQTPLRQFKGIQPDVLTRMEKKDLAWERYYDLSAQELGELIRLPKVGKALHRYVHQFPRLELAAHVQPITRAVLKARPWVSKSLQVLASHRLPKPVPNKGRVSSAGLALPDACTAWR